jgi:ATP-dependent Lon protease
LAEVKSGERTRDEFDQLEERRREMGGRLAKNRKTYRVAELQLRRKLESLDREKARPIVEKAVRELADRFDNEGVRTYLQDVQSELLESMHLFREQVQAEEGAEDENGETVRAEFGEMMIPYAVNVLVDNGGASCRPVVWETAPTYRNLFGTIEQYRVETGEWVTDHTRISGGAVLKANGGFLVLDAIDMMSEKSVWPALKRTLRNNKLSILAKDQNQAGGIALKPDPIPLDLKVILIGTHQIYALLSRLDEDFGKVFKVKAEFALSTPKSEEEIRNYACFVQKKISDDNLPPFHKDAVAAVVEEGVRFAGRQDRMTTRFNKVADLILEAGYWAIQDEADCTREKHVDLAVERRIRRHDLVEEVDRKRMAEGTVLLDITGEKVGQLNGLVVMDTGDHVFGQPARITAVTAVGNTGILDIERESEKSGSIHTKGVLILAGFLRERYAQDRPLALSASLCFEQNYGAIDGDSASSAELYALLSSLADVPLKQGLAVTGSVNQRGEIQPIGGVNSKIEGYFDLCRLKGLTGEQGVLIPSTNLPHLMLRKDVVEAIRRKEFRVWAIATIEQGMEILTGRPSGDRGADGVYPPGTIFRMVDERLAELAKRARKFRSPELPQ